MNLRSLVSVLMIALGLVISISASLIAARRAGGSGRTAVRVIVMSLIAAVALITAGIALTIE